MIHVNIWQKPPQYCKVISLQIKLINLKKPIKPKDGSLKKNISETDKFRQISQEREETTAEMK